MVLKGQVNPHPLYVLTVSISNTEPDLLQPFAELFGGKVRLFRNYHPQMNRKPCYRWQVYSKKAETFLLAVRPHLKGRKLALADLGLEFQSITSRGPGHLVRPEVLRRKGEIHTAMKSKNHRGRLGQQVLGHHGLSGQVDKPDQ